MAKSVYRVDARYILPKIKGVFFELMGPKKLVKDQVLLDSLTGMKWLVKETSRIHSSCFGPEPTEQRSHVILSGIAHESEVEVGQNLEVVGPERT